MKETGSNRSELASAQIPLFDEIPQELTQKEELIKQTFDGSIGTQGITMVLNPATGDAVMARLIDLLTGKVVSYEPLVRGRWTNPIGDLKEESPIYQKLERVYEDVRQKYKDWKFSPRRSFPIREWTTLKVIKAQKLPSDFTQPENWYRKEINPNEEDIVDQKIAEKTIYRKPTRQKTSRVVQSRINHDITPSRDEPRRNDAKPAPASLRRATDRAVKKGLARRKIHNS